MTLDIILLICVIFLFIFYEAKIIIQRNIIHEAINYIEFNTNENLEFCNSFDIKELLYILGRKHI